MRSQLRTNHNLPPAVSTRHITLSRLYLYIYKDNQVLGGTYRLVDCVSMVIYRIHIRICPTHRLVIVETTDSVDVT